MGFNFSYKDLIFDSCGLSETIKANLNLHLGRPKLALLILEIGVAYVCMLHP